MASTTPPIRCPAASAEHLTLSLNACDMRCAITGLAQDAEGSPCTGAYERCPVWRKEKERLWKSRRPMVSEKRLGSEGWA